VGSLLFRDGNVTASNIVSTPKTAHPQKQSASNGPMFLKIPWTIPRPILRITGRLFRGKLKPFPFVYEISIHREILLLLLFFISFLVSNLSSSFRTS